MRAWMGWRALCLMGVAASSVGEGKKRGHAYTWPDS